MMKKKWLMVMLGMIFNIMSFGETVTLTTGEWAPFTGEKIKGYGFANDVVVKSFAKIGINVEYKFYPWKRAYEMTKQGSYIGSSCWAKSKEREKDFYFSDKPIVEAKTVLFYIKGNDFTWETIKDLKGKKIGGTRGYSSVDYFKKNGMELDLANKDLLGFRKLEKGRINIFVCDLDVGLKLIRDNFTKAKQAKFVYHKKPIDRDGSYFVLNKKTSGNLELMKKYNEGFKMLEESGEYDKMLKELRSGKYN